MQQKIIYIIEVINDIGIEVKQFTKYTEEEARQIIDYLIDEGIWDFSVCWRTM